MARVKIKSTNLKDPRRIAKLLKILSCNDIYAIRLISVIDEFVVWTSNDEELDKLFNSNIDKKLEENEFFPQIPQQLKANRSVLLFSGGQSHT